MFGSTRKPYDMVLRLGISSALVQIAKVTARGLATSTAYGQEGCITRLEACIRLGKRSI